MKKVHKTVDAYLASLSPDKRAALQKVRETIQAAAPKAEEGISYGVPTYKLDGRMLMSFGAGASHCALYPGTVLSTIDADLSRYETGKGTIRFAPGRPLPAALVRKLVRARIAQNEASAARRR